MRIIEKEVASAEGQVVRPELQVSGPGFEIWDRLLYQVKQSEVGECVRQLLVPQAFWRKMWDMAHATPISGHFRKEKTLGKN